LHFKHCSYSGIVQLNRIKTPFYIKDESVVIHVERTLIMLQAQIKVKRNSSPCAHTEGIWGSEEIAQLIANFGIRWK
jgi:hypothetical protein